MNFSNADLTLFHCNIDMPFENLVNLVTLVNLVSGNVSVSSALGIPA